MGDPISTIFEWEKEEMDALLRSCDNDDCLPFINENVGPAKLVLESGCGTCRWVKYLSDRNVNIVGLEFSGDTLKLVKDKWPELEILQGDVGKYPFKDNSVDVVLSFGVVEHFKEGPGGPLREINRILKPGGIAIITTPCLNTVRKTKHILWYHELKFSAKNFLSGLVKNRKISVPSINRLNKDFKYVVFPVCGDFYEYRFTPGELSAEVRRSGLEIITQRPISNMDGIYHELNPFQLMVKFENWEFKPTEFSTFVNNLLSRRDFLHSHMQAIIATKKV
jgi:SAM-dependent methyltransferase